MYEEKIVLCGANSYERKFYINPDFEALPESIKEELEYVRQTLMEYNKILDEYNVNKEMRFDENDLVYSIRFHRRLFAFMPEEECEKAFQIIDSVFAEIKA